MCTERARGALPWRWIPVLLVLFAVEVHADPVEDAREWKRGPGPILLIVVADGLRADHVARPGTWEGELMPRTRAWADSSWVFTDVQSEFVDPRFAHPRMARGLEVWREAGFAWSELVPPPPSNDGATRVETQEAAILAAVRKAKASAEAQVVLAPVDFLLAPYVVPEDLLVAEDPEPWWLSGTADPARIEDVVERRVADARAMASLSQPGRLEGRPRDLERYRWVLRAAHARFDRFLGRLLDEIASDGAASRISLVLTATTGTATGAQRWAGAAVGARREVSRVPLIWSVPGASARRDALPRTLGDLERSARFLCGETDRPGLLSDEDVHRERFSFGAGETPGIDRPLAVAELRWTHPDFTLVDAVAPVRRRLLFDRRFDPEEIADRAWAHSSLADSLAGALLEKVYGATPRLILRAKGLRGRSVEIGAGGALRPGSEDGVTRTGSGALRWRIPGDDVTLELWLDEGPCDLRVAPVGGDPVPLRIGSLPVRTLTRPLELPLHGPRYLAAHEDPSADDAGAELRLRLESTGWLDREMRR